MQIEGVYTKADGTGKSVPLKFNEDGSLRGAARNIFTIRDAFESYTPGQKWTENLGSGDLVMIRGDAAAASYLSISKNPLLADTETTIESLLSFTMPVEVVLGAHMSQRTLGQEFSAEVVDTGTPLANIADLEIASISQTLSVLTVGTVANHGLSVGKSIGIAGCSNAVANYPALVVASVPSPTQFTCTAGPGGTIPSQTITNPAGAKGFVYFRERLGRAQNGASIIFEQANAAQASLYIRSEAGDALPSGTIVGNHSIAVGSTNSIALVNLPFQNGFSPSTLYSLIVQADRTQWFDAAVDSVAAATNRLLRNQICPDPAESYKLRIRATNNKSLTVPNAQVVSVTKSGSTTGTFVTDEPHGLVTGDSAVFYGSSDTAAANFPNLAVATAVTVVNANTFTAVIGTGTTGAAYGGFVANVQGGNLMSALGVTAQTAIDATLTTLSDGRRQLVLTGNGNWTGAAIGDLVNVIGCRSVPGLGTSLGVDGVWSVANVATTALTLVSLPGQTWPADFALTACGGSIIRRTEFRLSFVRIFDFERQRVEMLPRPAGDIGGAAPVLVQNTPQVTMTSTNVAGTVAADAAIGNPITAGLRASNANIAAMSAAGDSVPWVGTMIGAGLVKPYALPEATFHANLALTGAAPQPIAAAAPAGQKRHLVAVQAINTGASAVDLIILDNTTEKWRLPLPPNFPVTVEFPIHLSVTAATALNASLSAAGTVRANFQGYTAP